MPSDCARIGPRNFAFVSFRRRRRPARSACPRTWIGTPSAAKSMTSGVNVGAGAGVVGAGEIGGVGMGVGVIAVVADGAARGGRAGVGVGGTVAVATPGVGMIGA